jgi:putative endonuclease
VSRLAPAPAATSDASATPATPEKLGKPDPRRKLGAEGEARAASFLARRGYRIIERNVRADGVEVDLIARRGGVVIFVEVKTRRSRRHGAPELAVDQAKQRRLIRAATAWLHSSPTRFRRARFDVIACSPPDAHHAGWRIDHLPGAFEAGD